MGAKDDISIGQFINARIYAKKMTEFLRMRQELKKIENERKTNAKIASRQMSQARRQTNEASMKKSAKISKVGIDLTKLSP